MSKGRSNILHNEWQFDRAADGGTDVDFSVDFAFKSRLFETFCRVDVRPCAPAYDHAFELRAAALYGITVERAERCLKADAGARLFVEILLVGYDLAGVRVALRGRKRRSRRASGVFRRRARQSCDRHRDVGVRRYERAAGHRPCCCDADRAERVDDVFADLELADF